MKSDRLLPEERLEILKAADRERKWYALDDKRVCTVCDRVFTGRQVDMQRDQRGRYLLACPTPGCPSTISHWLLCEVSPALYSHSTNGNRKEFTFFDAP